MPDGGTKKPIDAATVALVASGQAAVWRNQARGFIAGADQGWFSPLQPMSPSAPAGTPPRILDYEVGYNLQIQPRGTGAEGVGFQQLRAMADGFDLLRMIIETRKDQIARMPIDFRAKAKPGEGSNAQRRRSDSDPAVTRVREFFEFPDREHDFPTWLRILLEDLFVLDAPSILVNRDRGGRVHSFEVIDGATIVPKIDAQGRRPKPPDVAFQQIIKGMPAVDLTTEQLVYRPRNVRSHRVYGFGPVEQAMMMINIGLRREVGQLDFFTEGTIPLGIAQVPDTWSSDQIKQFQAYFDSRYSGNQANRSKLIFTPVLEKLDFPKLVSPKDEFDEWIARVLCFCFSIPPTPFIRQMNRATAKSAQEVSTDEGTLALLRWLKPLLNYLVRVVMGETDVEVSIQTGRSSDPLKQSQIDASDVSNGILSPNEVRAERGLDPVPNGDKIGVKTATGFIPIGEAPPAPVVGEPDGNEPKADKAAVLGKKKVLTARPDLESGEAPDAIAGIERAVGHVLGNSAGVIAPDVARIFGATAKADDGGRRRLEELLAYLAALDFSDWQYVVAPAMQAMDAAAREAGAAASKLPGAVPGAQASADDAATAYARARAAEMVGMKWVDGALVANPDARWAITETTREGLRSLAAEAVSEGWSSGQLQQAIEQSYWFSEQRAETIARTEVAKAQVAGAMTGWKASGVVASSRWLLAPGHSRLDECDENAAAGEVPLGKTYPSGDYGAPAHPNCECAMVAVLKEGA